MKITIPYTPRKQQAYIHNNLDKFRYSLLCCHRRFGKTVMCINHLIKSAMTNKNHNPRFAYIAPTYSQAKKIAWDYLKFYTEKIPGTKWNESELRCDLMNGSRITLLSSENPDSIRGIYLDGCIIDEAAQISENLINEVITPALSDRKGFMILVGTPKGMNNLFYDYYQKAQANNNWFLYRAKASDTGIVDKEELTAALGVMGKSKYNQEFECSFIGNISGSIYGEIIASLDDKKQLCRVPLNPGYPVNTAWDLGYNDQTAIIFFQQVGASINIIDYYENLLEAIDVEEFGNMQKRYLTKEEEANYRSFLKFFHPTYYFEQKMNLACLIGLKDSESLRILDIGCGAGHFLSIAEFFGHEAIGLDLTYEELKKGDLTHPYGTICDIFGVKREHGRIQPTGEIPEIESGPFDLVTAFLPVFNIYRNRDPWSEETWDLFFKGVSENWITDGGRVFFQFTTGKMDEKSWSYFKKKSVWMDQKSGQALVRW